MESVNEVAGNLGEETLLLAPITPELPVGTFDEDDAVYQRLDTEMAKLGGLRQSSLDWTQVESDAIAYLSTLAKHVRVLGYLVAAWTRSGDATAWVRSVRLLAGWTEHYWVDAYPRPGPAGLTAKRKQWTIMLERLTQGLKSLRVDTVTDSVREHAAAALQQLEQAAAKQGLDAADIVALRGAFVRAAEGAKQAAFAPPTPKPTSSGSDTLGPEFFSTRSDLPLGDERETRKLFLKLAEFINQQDAFDPTGYLLRRYGLWSHLHAAPPVKREQRTELVGVPVDVSAPYQDALATRTTSPGLLLRVEKSVAASPFWLRGSFLAARIAQQLEMEDVATAVRIATHRFLLRLPRLRELAFADGTPFVDDETFAWIAASPASANHASVPAAVAGSLNDLRAELGSDAATLPVETLLQRLQRVQGSAAAPRERAFATVLAADVLAERGLAWLARDLHAGVLQAMDATAASVWDRDTYDYVKWQLRPEAAASRTMHTVQDTSETRGTEGAVK
ncbi:type VI secretion system protein TssA [Lysobacter arvi]|uniref:Type VI secretion system protein TssA n=1 Tax=Lysobacter arvi TaxID=3038776 RepID=A0ABU1CEV4_9GAMM|nr:type VI secretion system protein TssA [Lysobacter arvi]MDR0183455.1 type VI secretion system protein TssA [Lysobacter arvi]